MKIAFLGDSMFDNGAYVPMGDALADVLREFPSYFQVMFARDGACVPDVPRQITHMREFCIDPSVAVLSVGGNDALRKSDVLYSNLGLVEGLQTLNIIGIDFGTRYRELLKTFFPSRRTILCTIWNPKFEDTLIRVAAEGALHFFNDQILNAAVDFGFPVIDLRSICDDITCYANEIEPSREGVTRIVKMVHYIVENHDFSGPSVVYNKKFATK